MKKIVTALTASAAFATISLSQEADASQYTVQPGDSLWKLAQDNSVSIDSIKKLNKLSSDTIYVNQSITLKEQDTYTVQAGDTLSKIANQFGTNYRTLMDLNGITSHLIYPGQVLNLKEEVQAPAPEEVVEKEEPVVEPVQETVDVYTVQAGDTLAKIGSQFGIDYKLIASWNNIEDVNYIYVGQKLALTGSDQVEAVQEEVVQEEAEEDYIQEIVEEVTQVEEDNTVVETETDTTIDASQVETIVEVEAPQAEVDVIDQAAEQAEAERVAAEQAAAAQAEAERVAAEQAAAAQAEAERVAAEQAQAGPTAEEIAEAERVAAEQAAAAQAEAERVAAEQAAVQAEAERVAAEQAAAEQAQAGPTAEEIAAAEQAEAERVAAEQAAAAQAEAERVAAEQAAATQRANEQAEAERRAAEQAAAEQRAKEEAAAAAPAPAPSYGVNYYSGGQCTYYAFERRQQLGKSVGSNWGNAHNWANAARSQGYSVTNSPSVGAIMVFAQGQGGASSYYGHVAIVESVNGDGSINISEWNWTHGPWNKTVRTISASSVYNFNYIH